jgi:hypothetical protein
MKASASSQGARLNLRILIWREPQVNSATAGLDRVLQHLPAFRVAPSLPVKKPVAQIS